jgi:predicted lysophospholipase L1 biosynthesis ABC-type transport system permease subunit
MALAKPAGTGAREHISLDAAARHLLEECRMVLPGIQALFGFQLIAVFNQGFDEKLARAAQMVHLLALLLTALAMALVMTPAALHRLVEPNSVSERFVWIASNMVLAGMVPLAIGVGLDIYVVASVVTESTAAGIVIGAALLAMFAWLWFLLPRRERSRHDESRR